MEPLTTEPTNKSPIERSTAGPSAATLSNAKAITPECSRAVLGRGGGLRPRVPEGGPGTILLLRSTLAAFLQRPRPRQGNGKGAVSLVPDGSVDNRRFAFYGAIS
jgi:hypothetical protein